MIQIFKKIIPETLKKKIPLELKQFIVEKFSHPESHSLHFPRISYFRDIKKDPAGKYFAFLDTVKSLDYSAPMEKGRQFSGSNRFDLIFADIDFKKIKEKNLRILLAGGNKNEVAMFYKYLESRVHFCHSDPDTIRDITSLYPDMICWVQNFERPWTHTLKHQYDIVFALGILNSVVDPKPLLFGLRETAPLVYVDGIVVDSDESFIFKGPPDGMPDHLSKSILNTFSRTWIENQLKMIEFMTTPTLNASGNSDMELYGWRPKNSGTAMRNGKVLKRMYACERIYRKTHLTPLLVNVHLPKNAGTSFLKLLRESFGPKHLDMYIEDPRAEHTYHSILSPLQTNPDVVAISSHSFTVFPEILGDRIPLYICFLRNPLERYLSYYRYCKKNYHELTDSHKLTLPSNFLEISMDDFFTWKAAHEKKHGYSGNLQVEYFARTNDLSKSKNILTNFFFVGIVEEMNRSVTLLRQKLKTYGIHLHDRDITRENVTAELYDETRITAEHPGISAYLKNLETDMKLYKWAKQRFEADAGSYGV